MAVSSYRYETKRCDEALRVRLVELARSKPRFGYRRLHVLLEREGDRVNHKRVHRVYREAGLSLRRKKRKHCVREGKPLLERVAANQEWALDFVHDAVECGRTIRVLSVVDACTRECLALEVDTSFASRRVTRILEQIIGERGAPGTIRCDNGPEFTSRHFLAWCVERKIELLHIQPGKPAQNGRVESFHGRNLGTDGTFPSLREPTRSVRVQIGWDPAQAFWDGLLCSALADEGWIFPARQRIPATPEADLCAWIGEGR
jgi:putative transposase